MFLTYLSFLISDIYLVYLLTTRPPRDIFEWTLAIAWIIFGGGGFLLLNIALLIQFTEFIDGKQK